MKRSWITDVSEAASLVITALLLFPELAERRVWCYAGMCVTRAAARRCGQLAIAAENAYRREVQR